MATIKNWAEDDRPREKLMLKGADTLSNAELLAILINNGTVEKSAVELCKELMQLCNNNLQRLGTMQYQEIVQLKIKGLGPAKAVSIVAALELGLRRNMGEQKKEAITSSKDIAAYLKAQLQFKTSEVFLVIFLNQSNKILHQEIISQGGISSTVVDPRIIFKKALEYNSAAIILCHNHPSGSLKPSKEDIAVTNKLKEAAKLLDLKILDHLIVSNEGYFSFSDENLM